MRRSLSLIALVVSFLGFSTAGAYAQGTTDTTSIGQPSFGMPTDFNAPVIPTSFMISYYTTKPGRFIKSDIYQADANNKPTGESVADQKTNAQSGSGSFVATYDLTPGNYVIVVGIYTLDGNFVPGSSSKLAFTVLPPGTNPPGQP